MSADSHSWFRSTVAFQGLFPCSDHRFDRMTVAHSNNLLQGVVEDGLASAVSFLTKLRADRLQKVLRKLEVLINCYLLQSNREKNTFALKNINKLSSMWDQVTNFNPFDWTRKCARQCCSFAQDEGDRTEKGMLCCARHTRTETLWETLGYAVENSLFNT